MCQLLVDHYLGLKYVAQMELLDHKLQHDPQLKMRLIRINFNDLPSEGSISSIAEKSKALRTDY